MGEPEDFTDSDMASPGALVCQAECGATWLMDYEPAPSWCVCENMRLGIVGEGWGCWVDSEGNPVYNL